MGTSKRTSEEDYRHYARPEPGSDENWVEVIDDGSGRETPVESNRLFGPASGSVTNPDPAGAENVSDPAQAASGAPVVHRRNRSLWAAWALVAFALAVGISWFLGLFTTQYDEYGWEADGSFSSAAESSWLSLQLQMNLSVVGPILILVGLLGAIMLLAVQAVIFHRSPRLD